MFDSYFGRTVKENEINSAIPIQSLSPKQALDASERPPGLDAFKQVQRATAVLQAVAAAQHPGRCLPRRPSPLHSP